MTFQPPLTEPFSFLEFRWIEPVTLQDSKQARSLSGLFGGATRPASGMLSIASCNFSLKPYYASHP